MRCEENDLKSSEELLKEFSRDCSTLLSYDGVKEKEKFADTIEEVLSKLETFVDIADDIRSRNNQASDTILLQLKEKSKEIEQYFGVIDKLEAFTNVVKEHVNKAEMAVNKAETDLNASQFKKAISFLAIQNLPRSNSRLQYHPFPVLDTDLYFPLTSDNDDHEQQDQITKEDDETLSKNN